MAKFNLVIFIQSTSYSPYVNVLTHCVKHESVNKIYFVGKEVEPAKKFELLEHIRQIRVELAKYAIEYPQIYEEVLNIFPDPDTVVSQVFYIGYSQPQQLLRQLKSQNLLNERLIIDVTGCSKRLASDIITSYMAAGVLQIRYFELADKVHDRRVWKKSKMYHDLIEDYVTYYDYDDLSSVGVTAQSINKLRGQGRIIRFLLLLALVLGAVAALLANSNQNNLATLASLVVTAATSLGLIEDSLSIFERFRR